MSNGANALRFCVLPTLAKGGILAAAARRMDVTASAVSQSPGQLENRLVFSQPVPAVRKPV